MKYLSFQLFGLLQSWGNPLPGGYYRPSEDHPTKSGVVSGLIGACLGLKYGSPQLETLQSLNFACREDVPGTTHWDFHTVQVGESSRCPTCGGQSTKLGTMNKEDWLRCRACGLEYKGAANNSDQIISERQYLVGAMFTVCLWGETEGLTLEAIAEAIKHPFYTPFLGRKVCLPGLPFLPVITEAASLKEALEAYVPDSTGAIPESMKPLKPRVFWEGSDDSLTPIVSRQRRDSTRSAVNRTFSARLEHEGVIERTLACTSVS